MSATNNRRGPTDAAPYVMLAAALAVLVLVLGLWAAIAGGDAIAGRRMPARNPFTADIQLAAGRTRWPGLGADVIGGVELLVLAGLAAGTTRVIVRMRRPRRPVDAAAKHMATRREIAHLTGPQMSATAARLGVPTGLSPGFPVGLALPSRTPILGSWEDEELDLWGPRTGKTTSRAIPVIVQAPGAVLATSNKRDIVDGTRGLRERRGEVWVFDPHQIVEVDRAPEWWWNPLSYVVDVNRAMRLAGLLTGFSRSSDAKLDGFFDPEGEALLAFLLLAAAVGNLPLTQVYRWSTDQTDTQPVDILRAGGHDLPAKGIEEVINAPDKQRGGVYATAKKAVSFLVDPQITRWITPDPRRRRPMFNPHAFVRGTDTLYSMSMEGQNGAAIVCALNVAVMEAAEEYSTRSAGGRLPVPLVAVLDEAANGVRWKQLPDKYSHYGSRGIICLTILQSWSQGVEVWGEHGMRKLRDAANIRLYGGGSVDTQFLGDISKIVGKFEPDTYSLSSQRGTMQSRSTSMQTRSEEILDEADLAALPKGRAVVMVSGTRPILIETEPWTRGPHRAQIEDSFRRYSPTGAQPAMDESGELVYA
jgi:hypothetical protein